ncbi:MAG: hypothetical protein JRD89_13705 [Deltaproteobacteria bacterium]|nr:hypothetical protein [Deltaproteobacteria bacterium]
MGIVEINAKQFVEGGPLVYENPYDDPSNWYCEECGMEAGDGPGGSHMGYCNSREYTYSGPTNTEFTGPTGTTGQCWVVPFDPEVAQLEADSDGSEPMSESEYYEYNGRDPEYGDC